MGWPGSWLGMKKAIECQNNKKPDLNEEIEFFE